jgi:hypothetical protein
MLVALTIAVPLVTAVLLIVAAVLEEDRLVDVATPVVDEAGPADGSAPEPQVP